MIFLVEEERILSIEGKEIQYEYRTELSPGDHTYRFRATDNGVPPLTSYTVQYNGPTVRLYGERTGVGTAPGFDFNILVITFFLSTIMFVIWRR